MFPQSIYPPMLSRGLPRRHHIVTYLLLLSAEPHEQLEVSSTQPGVGVGDRRGGSVPEPRGSRPGCVPARVR